MSNLALTILLAAIFMGFVVLCLSIGYLITGKNRLRRGSCGMAPQEKGKKKGSCSLCGTENRCDDEEKK